MRHKTKNGLSFSTYKSVSAVNSEHWNRIIPFGSEFLHLDYLRVLEKVPPQNMRFYYSIVYDKFEPIAIAYFQVIDFSSESFGTFIEYDSDELKCYLTNLIKKKVTNHLLRNVEKFNMRLLICGNACISGEHGFAVIPNKYETEIFDVLADAISEISKAEKLRGKIAVILVKDFYENSIRYSKELEAHKFHDFLVEPNMIVNINWESFEEYLDAMSKKYRNRAKKIIGKGQQIKRVHFTAEDIKLNNKTIDNLYNNVQLKANFRMASLSAEYFFEMKLSLKENFRFVGYYLDDVLIGFRTSFSIKNNIDAHFIGIDYNLNKDLEIYQNILYDYVKDAIEKKSDQLYLGRTASEIKSTVGAKAYELRCYVRHRNPLSNRIIKPFIDYLKPTEWIPRNPFKEQELE